MLARIEDNEPVANENAITPRIMITIQKIFSMSLLPEMSPYPTVVIVVTVK